ncbi:NAD-dependent epimerase/dehydratase family protein [Paenibacillus yanchengensis]|uniref:NAD-dependent epimerase/dehydratase family protein n=1 Tax=Paenibacillus yanchengensis TaxID=2035833 RepID=A0ABW4YRF1_9BACL
MKILVTGGYGFIGSYVAERFAKENHEIFIIDNLRTGKKSNVLFAHTGYVVDVEDEACEQIFQTHQFDIVVHLAAQVSVAASIVSPIEDANINIIGLLNMLQLSTKYNVKKFIFASSAAVYGEQTTLPIVEQFSCIPQSPYGLSKYTGEQYCTIWNDFTSVSTLSFRFSNVYGPRQNSDGEGGVVSIFMDCLQSNKPLLVYGDGNQTRDFVFVEDVASAIYEGAMSSLIGIYNLSTNKQTSVNDIIAVLDKLNPVDDVRYLEARVGDIKESVLDNRKLVSALNWTPEYTIDEGLTKTAEYFLTRV